MPAPLLLALLLAGAVTPAPRTAGAPAPGTSTGDQTIVLGQAVVPLNGPWRFQTGDDARWSDPGFDDSAWETVDLTPPPGSHDDDVGLSGYVPGWMARGHAGYRGYAWYRIRLHVAAPAGVPLALAAPAYVDGAYEAYLNGHLLGGSGDFSSRPPVVYGRQPKRFPLPPGPHVAAGGGGGGATGVPVVVAIRVWSGPGLSSGADGGGIHIAPSIGEAREIEDHHVAQWMEVIRGYVVDATEPIAFLLLAIMAWSVAKFDRNKPDGNAPNLPNDRDERNERNEPTKHEERTGRGHRYGWLIAALLLSAISRANQATFFWMQWESIQTFDLIRNVSVTPLTLAAWILAWRDWFRDTTFAWLPRCVLAAAVLCGVATAASRPWFFPGLPSAAGAPIRWTLLALRLLLLLLYLYVTLCGAVRQRTDRRLSLLCALAAGVALFAQELSAIHLPGIWFPWGMGVSRTQYAWAVVDILLFLLLWRRLHRFAPNDQFTKRRSSVRY